MSHHLNHADLLPRECVVILENVDSKRLAESRKSLRKVVCSLVDGNSPREVDVERVRYILELLGVWATRRYHLHKAVHRYVVEAAADQRCSDDDDE